MTNIDLTTVSTNDVIFLVDFFKSQSTLKSACLEVGIDYNSARRNLNGPAHNVRLQYVVYLKRWVQLWEEQKIEREKLAGAK